MNHRMLSALGSLALVLALALVGLAGCGGSAGSDSGRTTTHAGTDPESGLPYIDASELPPEAQHTLHLIDQGGPYPYPAHDDQTFGNYEGILPKESTGYYREYTVVTPGSPDRGTRRIIRGRGGELYYTDDHYETFKRIRR